MFQLYKDRSFGDYISDTIDFFKKFGKHYFKSYFVINGIFLMILVVLLYFISKVYMEFIQTTITSGGQNNTYLTEYFNNNLPLFIVTMVGMVLLLIIISVINYAYPSLYVELYENKGTNFDTKDLIQSLKQNFGRILAFCIISLFVMIPIICIVFFINMALCFLIIGFPLLFITMPAIFVWVSLSFNDYLLGKSGYFESLGNGFSMLRQNFWPAVGSTLVMFIILYILQMIITMIPYMFGIASLFSTGQNLQDPNTANEAFGTFSMIMIAVMVLSTLTSLIFNNFQSLLQLLIYYSQLEENQSHVAQNEIDLIGTDAE